MRKALLIFILLLSSYANADSIIQRLKDEGSLVLMHLYASRSFYDFSGHGNHGTPTDVHFAGNRGVRFPASTSVITVSDSPELQLTEGTLVVFGEFMSQEDTERIISKRDSGGTNYEFYTTSTDAVVYDGTSARSVTTDITGKKYIAINIKSGEKNDLYIDGNLKATFFVSQTFTQDDADTLIGNSYNNGNNLQSTLTAALIVNRKLTASEHAELYAELASMRWPSRGFFRDKDADSTDGRVQFATTWAAEESSGLTSGWIPNTPLKISSGTWSVIVEEVDGKLSKVLRCDSAGIVYLDTSIVTGSPTNDAYGTWEWWISVAINTYPRIFFVAKLADAWNVSGQYGYILYPNGGDKKVWFYESTNGTVTVKFSTASSYLTCSTWHKFRVTRRDTDGQFTAYMDGELIDVTGGSGSNPVTDNTTTTSSYIVLDLDAGDKILLGSLDGQYSFVKYRGVWAP